MGKNGVNFLSEKNQWAIEKLDEYLNLECSEKPVRLKERQIRKYEKWGAIAAWAIQPPDISQRIIIFVDSRYPFSVLKTAIDPAPKPRTYPHIEEDGYLCIDETAVPKDEQAIEKVAQYIIATSLELIKECLSGENQKDFQDEILSYWDRAKNEKNTKCYSLLDLNKDKSARKVKIWNGIQGENITFIADTKEQGERWLNQKLEKKHSIPLVEDALFAWSDKILMPTEYPKNNKEAYEFLEKHCGSIAINIYREIAGKTPNKIDIIIGFQTDSGRALVGIILYPPFNPTSYGMNADQEMTKGFRSGNVDPIIAGNRYASTNTISHRLNVKRVDPSWSLSRDSDARIELLKEKTVTVVGCGSIGSEVLRMLAQNGVNTFNLIDPDKMEWENIGRYALGANAVGLEQLYDKVDILKVTLEAQFPHIKINSLHPKKWEEVIQAEPEVFYDSSLIIMTTGDWPADNAMNKYMLAQDNFPPILYGWAEAYAIAGHSFAVLGNRGCFNCAFEDTTFKFELTQFVEEKKRLPACGGVFQPYRSIELAPINSIIAAHAIDILTGKAIKSQIRSWLGSNDILLMNHGIWTEVASSEILRRGALDGQFMMENNAYKDPTCKSCGGKAVL